MLMSSFHCVCVGVGYMHDAICLCWYAVLTVILCSCISHHYVHSVCVCVCVCPLFIVLLQLFLSYRVLPISFIVKDYRAHA